MKNFSVLRAALLMSTIVITGTSHAAEAKPSTDIRGDMIKQCTENFVKNKILSDADAGKFCKCNITVEGNMKNSEQWEIQSMINAGKNPTSHPAVVRSRSAGDKLLQDVKLKVENAQKAAIAAAQAEAAKNKK
jgi:hypothetical protein